MALNPNLNFHSIPQLSTHRKNIIRYPVSISKLNYIPRLPILCSISKNSDEKSDDNPKPRRRRNGRKKTEISEKEDEKTFPTTIPKKSRRGRRSEAAAVEDYLRNSLEKTFAAIREQSSEVMRDKENVMKGKIDENDEDNDDDNEILEGESGEKKKMVVEEEDPDWPSDADVGWGVRASEYFDQHPIKNVFGEDGVEIDWEGELDDNLVKEINCLEWESFAFHPSPLIVLVFERYNRASDNWRALKELEKAAKVYWSAKDRLPPRTVKLDMNIETDLAYALEVRECPQILFLRGNRILHREEQIRTADELVQMIAHFYYKAKKPSWMKAKITYQ